MNSNTNMCYKSGSCPKAGIKIHESNNEYKRNPFENQVTNLDLNIDNYELNGIYKLFNINSQILDDHIMKEARKFLLKLHPDKSNLSAEYFIFYSKAYKRLSEVYEYQNKSTKKNINVNEFSKENKFTTNFYNEESEKHLKNYLESNKIMDEKDPKKFNSWFNEQFDKYGKDNIENENGYDEWFRSDKDLLEEMTIKEEKKFNNIFEEQKKKKMELILLNNLNQNKNDYGDNDLRRVYGTESIIPVSEDDYKNRQNFKNINEYKNYRDSQELKVQTEEEALSELYKREQADNEMSSALAFKYAKQLENSKKSNELFWANLKQIQY